MSLIFYPEMVSTQVVKEIVSLYKFEYGIVLCGNICTKNACRSCMFFQRECKHKVSCIINRGGGGCTFLGVEFSEQDLIGFSEQDL